MTAVAAACALLALAGGPAGSRFAPAAQEPTSGPAAPSYDAAVFNADRKRVQAALASARELASRNEFDAAVAELVELMDSIRPESLRVTLWLTCANFHQAAGRSRLAATDLESAEGLLADVDEATRRRERCGQLASYLASQRAKLYLDGGLVDLAHQHVARAQALLPPRAPSGKSSGTAQPTEDFERERILANYVEALVLGTMEDYGALERAVTAALEDEVYAKYPGQSARLLARLGSGLKESARTKPEDAPRARANLVEALADPALAGLDRVLPELDLAELALRESDWEAAERGIAAAAEAMGPLEGRSALPAYAAWTALSARLVFERTDRVATRAELEAMRGVLERALELRVAEWGRRELRPGGYGPMQYADQQSLVSELVRLDLHLDQGRAGIERALARLLAAESTGTLARRLAAPAVSLSQVRETLLARTPGHALLVYFPAPNRTHLFVVRRDSSAHFELPAADFVELARFEAERTLQRALPVPASAWRARERGDALARLRDLLLPPAVCAELEQSPRWTIVGEDLLGPVPFEALSIGDVEVGDVEVGDVSIGVPTGSVTIGTTRALARLPSLAVGVRLAARADSRPAGARAASVLLLAPPLELSTPLTEAEIAEMVTAYPADSRRIVLGPQARLTELEGGLGSVRVLQVLAHGRHDPLRERPAGMLLASSQGSALAFVGAEEVANLDAPPLVLLTVCGAGRGPRRRGDAGAADLAGAFLTAGERARCVVLSPNDLDVESARQISMRFHAALLGGDAPAEALRKARAGLASDERFADPFHHASIVVVGLGHEALFLR